MSVPSAFFGSMDRLFLDTNVLLDVLEGRPAFVGESLRVLSLAKSLRAEADVSALSLSDITYILRKSDQDRVLRFFGELRTAIGIAAVGGGEVDRALASGMADFEDALQWQAAQSWKATHFITRNTSDFPAGEGPVVVAPADYLASL